ERDAFLALLVWVPRIPQAIPPFVATVLVPAPCRTRRARCFAAARGATLARNACQSEPSAAHVAKTVSTVGSGRAGVPSESVGTGKHCHGRPVDRRHTMRLQTR